MSGKKASKKVDAERRSAENTSPRKQPNQDCDVRELVHNNVRLVIVGLLENDADIMKAIVTSVTDAIINSLMENDIFTAKLVDSVLHAKAMDDIKQQIYEASTMDNEKSAQETTTLQARVSDLENENVRLRNETDSLEQYSRRNCLVFHGIPENEKDTTEAVVRICQSKLGLPIDRNIHRQKPPTGQDDRRNQPKTASYHRQADVLCPTE